ncbi:hypothetical protein A3B87_03715 [Candidatus Kuenenbacteria bacterium RIFCSPHIGHO2_02_FULL_39_13]|uniref:EamA domain-containing protein n=1 Tax=Candidatus Kuenenbacteria bacterium RIFCSPHIGHO2_02_FULL_39_13 TaxID=1798561 RepID=A0A1F6FMJ3_9BACT|nr:MAG: hypothetical protein A3B87_03715 [Candidatus Kuenenbacteria bacterium RIFCSPHIGHO2_02_FULL_39_13]
MGIFFALIALFSWGAGDFLIQKSVRRVAKFRFRQLFFPDKTRQYANLVVLFYIVLIGSLVLLPFIVKDLGFLFQSGAFLKWGILILASLTLLFAAVFDFQALKIGKLAVVEPILSFEIPVTALAAFIFIKERLELWQILLVACIFIGIFLISIQSFKDFKTKNFRLEKGVIYVIAATLMMGLANFLVGLSARETSPLLINWFLNVFILISLFIFLSLKSQLKVLVASNTREHKRLIFVTALIDNTAWIAYAYSVLYLPMAIALGITESYIALAAILGLVVNKEKLKPHQLIGLIVTVTMAVILILMVF